MDDAFNTHTTTIGDHTFHIRELGASQAKKLLVRLTKAVGPILGALADGPVPSGAGRNTMARTLANLDTKAIRAGLESLAAQLKEEDLDFLCSTLGSVTQVETEVGKMVPLSKERQEVLFRGGRLLLMFRWLAYGLEVQFRDFLDAFGELFPAPDAKAAGAATEKASSPSESPTD